MRYRVQSLGPNMALNHTVVDAVDESDARRQVQALGHQLVALKAVRGSALGPRHTAFPLVLFSQELLALLAAGVGIVEALETLAEKETRPTHQAVLNQVLQGLREGQTLSAAMGRQPQAFGPLYVATVRASERTSNLGDALGRYIAYAQQLEVVRGKLVNAAIYPAMLVAVSALVVLFLMGYVVPRFAHIYEDMGDKLPWMSHLMLRWGQTVEQQWPWLLGLLVLLGVALAQGGGRWLGSHLLTRLWRIPALGERMRVFQLARLYRTLGMLLRGGIPAVSALDMVADLLTPALQPALVQATRQIREGQSLSQAFDQQGLTTSVSTRMLRVGERTGQMGDMMERAAAFHDEDMARWADHVTRLMGPVLMLLMGVVIGGIVVLMYLPIFQLAESIQ
jgi:general secretion pathway protein F